MKRKGTVLLLILGALLMVHTSAKATDLLPGGTVTPPDSLAPGGSIVADTGVLSWTGIGGAFSGLAETQIYRDPGNVYCAGCLDFIFAVSNNAASTTSIARISDTSFAGFKTDAGIASNISCNAGTNIAPASADRAGAGDVVGFNFAAASQVLPGECSAVLVIETNAVSWKAGTLHTIDGDIGSVASYAPAVPETATTVLLGVAMLMLGLFHKKLFAF